MKLWVKLVEDGSTQCTVHPEQSICAHDYLVIRDSHDFPLIPSQLLFNQTNEGRKIPITHISLCNLSSYIWMWVYHFGNS